MLLASRSGVGGVLDDPKPVGRHTSTRTASGVRRRAGAQNLGPCFLSVAKAQSSGFMAYLKARMGLGSTATGTQKAGALQLAGPGETSALAFCGSPNPVHDTQRHLRLMREPQPTCTMFA